MAFSCARQNISHKTINSGSVCCWSSVVIVLLYYLCDFSLRYSSLSRNSRTSIQSSDRSSNETYISLRVSACQTGGSMTWPTIQILTTPSLQLYYAPTVCALQWHPSIIIIVKEMEIAHCQINRMQTTDGSTKWSKFVVTSKSGQEFTQVHRGAWCPE